LNVDGKPLPLGFTFKFNEVSGYWVMGIFDRAGVPLLAAIPLLTGDDPACNVLKQYAYLGVGAAFVINVSGTLVRDYPGQNNLGTDFILIWGDTPIG